MVKRINVIYWVDVGLALTFTLSFLTGILKWPRFLPNLGIKYSSLPMNLFTKVHDLGGLAMGLLVIVHIILHWNWIVCMTKKKFNRKVEKCEI